MNYSTGKWDKNEHFARATDTEGGVQWGLGRFPQQANLRRMARSAIRENE